MAEDIPQSARDSDEDALPEVGNRSSWLGIIAILAVLVAINILAFVVSFGAGIIVTVPLTLFLAFVLLKNIIPPHRLPMGRPRRGTSA